MLFKNQFRHVTFYSMPSSILFTFRKRINFIVSMLFLIFTLMTTLV